MVSLSSCSVVLIDLCGSCAAFIRSHALLSLSLSLLFLLPCTVDSFHSVKGECDELVLSASVLFIFRLLIHSSARSIISICRECHHLVLLHLLTFFLVSITAVDLSSHAHPMARHLLSAITSCMKSELCIHIFLAILRPISP